MENNKIKIVILAAGKGTRMKSDRPKALTEIRGKLMLHHLRESIAEIHPEKPIVVIGHQAELVRKELGDAFVYAMQADQLGTAHAVLSARSELEGADHIMVLYGDNPFIKGSTMKEIMDKHIASGATATFATTEVPNFENEFKVFLQFGRIIRKENKIFMKEYKDATEEERKIKEVNVGSFVFKAEWLWENISQINNENAQKEFYVNDLVKIATLQGALVETVKIDPSEAFGVNSREELEILEKMTV